MAFIMMSVVCVSLSACGSDDDGDGGGGGSAGMAGLWKMYYERDARYDKDASGQWQVSRDTEREYADNEGSHGFLFDAAGNAKLLTNIKSDGTYQLESQHDPDFKYKISGGKLFIMSTNDRDTDGWEDMGQITITGNTFELSYEEIDGSRKYIEVARYKKI